jgi:hypothetical protein
MLRSHFARVAAVAITMAAALVSPRSHAATPEIWFGPLQAYNNRFHGRVGVSDFQDLFQPDAPWQRAVSNIQVFEIGIPYMRTASDDDLRQMFAFLKHRHIALAIGIGLLPNNSQCPHVEGQDNDQLKIARRFKSLGGEVAFFSADSPLAVGYANPTPGCNLPTEILAQQAAETARAIRSVYPNVQFVDVEPVSNLKEPDVPHLISRWHAAFAATFGERFASFRFDIDWHRPWQERVRSIYIQMLRDHIPVQVYCDGGATDLTDAAWMAAGKKHCAQFIQLTRSQPQAFLLDSWFPHPGHALPENDPNSFTHMIMDFAANPPH